MGFDPVTWAVIGSAAASVVQSKDTQRRTAHAAEDAKREAAAQSAQDRADGIASALKTETDAATASNTRAKFLRQSMRANSLLTGGGESPSPARTTLGV